MRANGIRVLPFLLGNTLNASYIIKFLSDSADNNDASSSTDSPRRDRDGRDRRERRILDLAR